MLFKQLFKVKKEVKLINKIYMRTSRLVVVIVLFLTSKLYGQGYYMYVN